MARYSSNESRQRGSRFRNPVLPAFPVGYACRDGSGSLAHAKGTQAGGSLGGDEVASVKLFIREWLILALFIFGLCLLFRGLLRMGAPAAAGGAMFLAGWIAAKARMFER